MKVKVIHILRPKAPEHQLCSGARGTIINYTQLWTDFLVSCLCQRSSCVYKEYVRWFYLCLCRLVPEIQVWKHVQLLDLVALTGHGGLGLLGDWGPLKFAPQQSESQVCQGLAFMSSPLSTTAPSTPRPCCGSGWVLQWRSWRVQAWQGATEVIIFNFTFDTKEVVVMVAEVVIRKKENAKPLTLWNWTELNLTELSVRNAPLLGLTTATSVICTSTLIFTHIDRDGTNYRRLGQRNSCCSFILPQVTCSVLRVILCLIFILLIWVWNPRIKSLFPPECQAFILQKPVFWVLNFLPLLAEKKVKVWSDFEAKGSRTPVVLWSPRWKHLAPSNGLTFRWAFILQILDFIVKSISNTHLNHADLLWINTSMETSPSPCPSWACGPRGAGFSGAIGDPSIFSPTVEKSRPEGLVF